MSLRATSSLMKVSGNAVGDHLLAGDWVLKPSPARAGGAVYFTVQAKGIYSSPNFSMA